MPVFVPLPAGVVEALNSLPSPYKGKPADAGDEYFFWTGSGELKSAIGKLAASVQEAVQARRVVGR